jgi:hypothetical protein
MEKFGEKFNHFERRRNEKSQEELITEAEAEDDLEREKIIEIIDIENLTEINIDKKDVLEIKKEIDDVLGKEWDLTNEKIQIGIFTNREDLERFASGKNIPLEKLTNDSALFYINPSTKEKYVFVNVNVEKSKRTFENTKYSEEEVSDFLKRNTLAGIAHEITHMHSFFEKHGNEKTNNLWEQEMICNYVENKTRGDISEMLIEWGYIDRDKIKEFTIEHGNWDSFSKEEKNSVIDYFYPFLVEEYGLDNTRKIWERLQVNTDISTAIRKILEVEAEEVVTNFKQKTIGLIEKY